MVSKKGLIGAAVAAAALGTRLGLQLAGTAVTALSRRFGPGGSDPFAVAPSQRDVIPPDASAEELPPAVRQDFAADLPPTPGTVAVAVGAPNAPDLDVVAGDHDTEHRPER